MLLNMKVLHTLREVLQNGLNEDDITLLDWKLLLSVADNPGSTQSDVVKDTGLRRSHVSNRTAYFAGRTVKVGRNFKKGRKVPLIELYTQEGNRQSEFMRLTPAGTKVVATGYGPLTGDKP